MPLKAGLPGSQVRDTPSALDSRPVGDRYGFNHSGVLLSCAKEKPPGLGKRENRRAAAGIFSTANPAGRFQSQVVHLLAQTLGCFTFFLAPRCFLICLTSEGTRKVKAAKVVKPKLPRTADFVGFLQLGMKMSRPLVAIQDLLEPGAPVLVPVVTLVLPASHPDFLICNPEPG